MSLGEHIRETRKKKGMTLAQVAKQIGITEASLQRYESGQIKNPKKENLRKLAGILEVDYNYLLGYDSPSNKSEQIGDEMMNDLMEVYLKIGRRERYQLLVKAYELEKEMRKEIGGD